MKTAITRRRMYIVFLIYCLFLFSNINSVSGISNSKSSVEYKGEIENDPDVEKQNLEGELQDRGETSRIYVDGKGDQGYTDASMEDNLEADIVFSSSSSANPDVEIEGELYDWGDPSYSNYYIEEDWRPTYDRSEIEWRPIEESETYRNIEFGSDGDSGTIETAAYNAMTGVETIITPQFGPTPESMPELSFVEPYAGLIHEPAPESVYGDDERWVVESQNTFPWRTICKLYITASDGTNWVGSGAIIDDFHVMTAGHCAFLHDNGGWASSIEVVPAMDTSDDPSDPNGHAWVTFMRSYTGWTVSESDDHDWAVLTLDRNIGTFTGWMGRMTAGSDSTIYDEDCNIAGYPTDLSSGGRMWASGETGRGANEYNHYYELDTFNGMSGAPVWRYVSGSRYILTVHAYGQGGEPYPNYGTRLNTDKFNRIFTWLGEDTAPTDKPDMEDRGAAWRSATAGPLTAGVDSFTVSHDVRNIGTTSTGGYYVHYYASTNSYISTSDYYIGYDYISSTSALSYSDASWTGTFPSIPEGDYYIGWIIDKDDNVDEFDENNNKAYISTKRTVVGPPPPTGYIEVVVRESVTADYLQNAYVEVYETSSSSWVDAGYTDANGFYNVTALDIGWHTVYVSKTEYYSDSKDNYINWEGDDDYLYFYLDILPEDSGYIEVNVKDIDTSNPLSSAYVETYNISSGLVIDAGYTNGAGFYNITNLRIGWYEVQVSRYSYKPQTKQNYINWRGDDDYLYFYLDQMPPDSGFIEVRVYNETGYNRSNAYIECVNDTSGFVIDTGYTDAGGFYNITGLTIGWYTINVTYPGYYEQSKSNYINWFGDDDYLTYYLMSMPPDSGYIEVNVFDSVTYSAISNAYVEVVNQSSALVIQTGYTDTSGFFKVVNLTIGWYTVNVSRVGYYDQSKTNYINWAGDDDYLYFYLDELPPDSGYIEVLVKDINDNQPIQNALVTCYFGNGTYFSSGYTDATGFYNITGLYVGWYEVLVTHTDYGGESKDQYINWNGDDDYLYYYLDLKPPGYVEVSVFDLMTNVEMKNVYVQCFNYTSGELVDTGYTDSFGFYNITDLLPGWWVVNVSYVGFVSQSKYDYINWRGDDDYLTFNLVRKETSITGPVAIFRDLIPWNRNATEPILEEHSISYTIYSSSDMGIVDLSTYQKVIIASDQPQTFYQRLGDNMTWLQNYVSAGGILEIHACDNGWQDGDWGSLFLMPGGLNKTEYFEWKEVSINITQHPVLQYPYPIEGAELDSWIGGYFTEYTEHATVILIEPISEKPVLLELPFGSGYVVASTHALEWNMYENISKILENIVLYNPPVHDRIILTSPESSDSWVISSTQLITWNTTGTISDVIIALYENDTFVMEINASTPNDGEYLWNVPLGLDDSTQYQIVVSDLNYPLMNDSSDSFEIFADATDPVLNHPSDIEFFEGSIGHSITWDPTDDYPLTYEIFQNGSSIKYGLWNSSLETMTVVVDGLALGVYSFSIEVVDIGGNIVSDEVIVTVTDGTPPEMDHPADIGYSEGTTGHTITWTPSDAHPVSYEIFRDGTSLTSGPWNSSSEAITVVVDGLALGDYNYTILVLDIGGNNGTDEVIVSVTDGTSPVMDHPDDIEYSEGTTGHTITWSPTDAHPVSYEIYLDGSLEDSGPWNSVSGTISIDIDGLALGTYNYTIVVTDIGGNTGTDEVTVTVYDDTNPTIDHPADIQIQQGATGNNITWIAYDLHPDTFEFRKNGSKVFSGLWDGSSINVEIVESEIGVYEYTLIVYDTSGNSATDSVMVEVIPGGILGPLSPMTTMIVIGAGAFIVVMIIIIIIKKKK